MAKAAFFRRLKLGGTSGDEALVLGAFGCGYFGPLDLGSFFLCVGFSDFFYWTIFFGFSILDFRISVISVDFGISTCFGGDFTSSRMGRFSILLRS